MLGFISSSFARPVCRHSPYGKCAFQGTPICGTSHYNQFRYRLLPSRSSSVICSVEDASPSPSSSNDSASEATAFDPIHNATDSLSDVSGEEVAEPKLLKWSELPFEDIHEELEAIDEYQEEEELRKDDPWPQFLRGAAYEYWGHPKLALAQYALTKNASGLRKIPMLWERRAYNAFKLGEVIAANAYFDLALVIHNEAGGNPLHFSHWFNENFVKFVPKQNGPHPLLQHAVCKYCASEFGAAVNILVAQIAVVSVNTQHALLWFFASSTRRAAGKGMPVADLNAASRALQSGVQWDQRLGTLIMLFAKAAQGDKDGETSLYKEIVESTEADIPHIDITTNTYLALYHDAFTSDFEKRDAFFEKVQSIVDTPSPNDTENFLYHAAKNRFTAPADSTMKDIPELVKIW